MITPYRPQIGIQHILERGKIAEAFHRANAAEYIGKVSVYENSKLDIVATAQRVPIAVVYDSTMGEGGLYTPRIGSLSSEPKPRVNLRPDLSDEEERLTFAHELGHHFLEDVLNIGYNLVGSIHEPISEAFCEFFGHKASLQEPTDDAELEALVKDSYEIPADYGTFVMQQLVGQNWGEL